MKQCVVAVFDRAAQLFGRPFFVQAPGQAIRSFTDEVNRKDDQRGEFARHPDDFDLFHLGEYDDTHATFEILAKPRQLALGRDLKKRDGK